MALSWTLFLIETKTGRDYLDALLMEGRGDAYGYGNTTCLFFNLSRSLTNRTYSSKERTIYMACVSLATCPTNSTESRVTESVGWRCALLTQTWRWTKSCHDLWVTVIFTTFHDTNQPSNRYYWVCNMGAGQIVGWIRKTTRHHVGDFTNIH